MKHTIAAAVAATFIVFASSLLCGAEVQQLDPRAAAAAWETIAFLPADTPSVSGGGLVVESEPNGIGRKVWLTLSQSGSYLLVGHTCSGDEIRLGELSWETNPHNPVGSVMVYDSDGAGQALPFFSRVCVVGVIRINGGQIERSVVEIDPWRNASVEFPIGSEGIMEGKYYLSLLPLQEDAIVILGRGLIAEEIRRSPAGSVVIFPQMGVPPPGPTTITVCSEGLCGSVIFQRKLWIYPDNNGKG